jgi:hypothetical protein
MLPSKYSAHAIFLHHFQWKKWALYLLKYCIWSRSKFHNYCLDKFYSTFLLDVPMTSTLHDTQQNIKNMPFNAELRYVMVVIVKPVILSVITMSVVRLIVVAPISEPSTTATTTRC